jgi:hypothetical protein
LPSTNLIGAIVRSQLVRNEEIGLTMWVFSILRRILAGPVAGVVCGVTGGKLGLIGGSNGEIDIVPTLQGRLKLGAKAMGTAQMDVVSSFSALARLPAACASQRSVLPNEPRVRRAVRRHPRHYQLKGQSMSVARNILMHTLAILRGSWGDWVASSWRAPTRVAAPR